MSLGELLPELAGTAHARISLKGLTLDSRSVREGDAFVALRGERHDGIAYVRDAVRRGAVAVLYESGSPVPEGGAWSPIPCVAVSGLAPRVAEIAARFYGEPSRALTVIGVTGTNGKTTCTQLIAQAFGLLGRRCAVIGTLGWGFPGKLEASTHTTPDAVSNQRLLAAVRDQGAAAVAMEVSSHALKQGRVGAIRFRTAVFTNLTHDHLDYHRTLDDYAGSKKLLFEVPGLQHAVVNADDAFGRRILASLPAGVAATRYGIDADGIELRVEQATFGMDGVYARLSTAWGAGELRAPLLGSFNLSNALAALGVLCVHGVPLQEALDVFPRLKPVPGRMELISAANGPMVIIDYAHTPDALEQSLRALRQHCRGRLWCVFGCGGDRDRVKRPLMGRIAWEHADEVIITSDNPRSENASRIIDDICAGIPEQGVRQEVNRADAIRLGIESAQPGDCVLIAGKGHEDYQEIQGERFAFSDADNARRVLASLEGGR
jgi:UDP-N-acetylmuramoyl-L-alanyl-D-glutamate--2,6-diaminopimelate ligase